jgi:hypothetical protein
VSPAQDAGEDRRQQETTDDRKCGTPTQSTSGRPLSKTFHKRDVPDSTSFWNSNVTIRFSRALGTRQSTAQYCPLPAKGLLDDNAEIGLSFAELRSRGTSSRLFRRPAPFRRERYGTTASVRREPHGVLMPPSQRAIRL